MIVKVDMTISTTNFESMKFSLTSCEIGPNFKQDDAKIAFLSLFYSSIFKEKTRLSVINFFQTKYPNYNVPKYFTRASRTGLYLLLKSLDLPHNSQVALQGFSCVVVPNAVLQAGLTPVILDINVENFNLNIETLTQKWNPNIRVLIIQHTFGLSSDWTNVVNFCKEKNIIIIEDCAHALGLQIKLNGKLINAGEIGQACFFSFGRDKIVSCTNGGLAIIKAEEKEWIKNMDKNYSKLGATPNLESFRNLFYICSTVWFIRPYYSLFGKGLFWILAKFQFLGDVYTEEEKHGTNKIISAETLSKNMFPVLANQLTKLEDFNLHRKTIAKFYSDKLGIKYEYGSVFLRFPVMVSSSSYLKILSSLKSENILLGKWYQHPFIPKDSKLSKFHYNKNDSLVTEKLIKNRVLNLPTNPNTSMEAAIKIAETIAKFDKA